MKNRSIFIFLFILFISSNVLCMGSPPGDSGGLTGTEEFIREGKAYDGIWFLGFNLKKPLFGNEDGRVVRQSFAMAINKKVVSEIITDDILPGGVIPPGMEGHDPTIRHYPYDLGLAKRMMRTVGYSLNDRRIKNLTILHTDGKLTKRIVNRIKMDLINIGVDMTRIEVSHSNTAKWKSLLSSGKYDIFVIGYKAGSIGELFIGDKEKKIFHTFACYLNPTYEANQIVYSEYEKAIKAGYSPCKVCGPKHEIIPRTEALLQPLFHSEGEANFTFFNNNRIDTILNKLVTIDRRKKLYRHELLNEIGRTIRDECIVVPFFYITRL